MWEVESRYVVDLFVTAICERLPARSYEVAHADTGDARGIDVAFIYDPARLEAPDDETFFHVVMRRNVTREVLEAPPGDRSR